MERRQIAVVVLCAVSGIAAAGSASAQVSCAGVPAFLSCTAYVSGASVVFNGSKYTALAAIPATRDCPPSSPYDPASDNWWTNNGTCSGATATPTTPTTATATPTRTSTATATPTTVTATPTTATATPTSASATQVSLSSVFNVSSAYTDGTTFATTGGIDGVGSAYSSTLLGSSLSWGGVGFTFGAANQLNGVRNTTITLPAGQFGTLRILGTGVNGDQTSQTVRVNYTDGTSSTFTQTFSNWLNASQNVAGQSIALTTAYRNKSTGVKDNRAFNLYGYSFALTSTKTVSSLVLPATNNVILLAATLSSDSATPTPTSATATPTRTPTATATRTSTPTATRTSTPTPSGHTMEIMTWVPSYNQSIWMAALNANTGGTYNPRNTLTRIAGQMFQVQSNGTIVQGVPDSDVQWLVNYASANNIKFLICTHNYLADWDWGAAASAFGPNKTALVNNLANLVTKWGAAGVDVDFEGNLAGDPNRAEYAAFIQALGTKLHGMNKELTVDIFAYIWNQPNMNWTPDWVGYVDGVNSMGYNDLYGGGPDWQAYRWQQDTVLAAGYKTYQFQMGMPGWLGDWGSGGLGTSALAHVNELNSGSYNRLPTSIAIWDGQFNGAGWQSAAVWDGLHQMRMKTGN
jgi:Glycosyl hydrolases family 18